MRLLAGFSRISSYTPVATAGITLQAALGLKVGNSSTIYTQAFTWTAGGDLADPYFVGVADRQRTQVVQVNLQDSQVDLRVCPNDFCL